MSPSILRKKIGIEKQIDDFLDQVSKAGLMLKQGVKAYLDNDMEAFQQQLKSLNQAEHIGDALRRSLEERLYSKTLIPESRGDVLELLESMDSLLNRFQGGLVAL